MTTYLIDFFGTVFDGDAYKASGLTPEDDLTQFVYPDAARLLRDKENGAIIISSASEASFGPVVRAALRGIPRIAVIYTDGVMKGEYLAPHIGMHGAAPVFADDSSDQVASMALRCPGVRVFEVRRDGNEGDGRWPVIRSLAELP